MKQNKDRNNRIRLNKYLANAGIANRRAADLLIQKGEVKVNDVLVREMGFKVDPIKDKVEFRDVEIPFVEEPVYILLNKATKVSLSKSKEFKSIHDFIPDVEVLKIQAFNPLRTQDCGLVLLSNDRYLLQQLLILEKPLSELFALELDQDFKPEDIEKLEKGITLKEGPFKVLQWAFPEAENKRKLGLEIADRRRNIVPKVMENMGYDINKLDQTKIGNLTKKNLPRGKWRQLSTKELIQLRKLVELKT